MNRTGLVIALGLSLAIGLLFGIFPELDLKLAALFFDPASGSFPKPRTCSITPKRTKPWRAFTTLMGMGMRASAFEP